MLVVALLTVAAAAGCAKGRSARQSDTRPATVHVENRSHTEMGIYIVEGSMRRRLGTARSLATTTLTIPVAVVGAGREVVFLADPIGGMRSAVSSEIYVNPGQSVRLIIPP